MDGRSIIEQPRRVQGGLPDFFLMLWKIKKKLLIKKSKWIPGCAIIDRPHITQGDLAFKIPISILTWTQSQHRCQIFCKIVLNYVSISDFTSRQLNLRKPQKPQKFSENKMKPLKNANCNQGSPFLVSFLSILDIWFAEFFFWPILGGINEPYYKMGAWWQNLSSMWNI